MNNELTIIITFLNEGIEIENTLQSIQNLSMKNINILLIDDCSDDEYDYSKITSLYNNVQYHKNKERLGVAASRDFGVSIINTPYFLLLDGHMRLYEPNTINNILCELKRNERAIFCCQTKRLMKENGICKEEPTFSNTYGAYIQFYGDKGGLYANWIEEEKEVNCNTENVPCILGAAYAGSKKYWEHLKGLNGLLSYGSDEILLSLKVWLEGGCCKLLKNVTIGHIYRKTSPFIISSTHYVYNKIYIVCLLLPQNLRNKVLMQLKKNYSTKLYNKAYILLYINIFFLNDMKKYLSNIFTQKFSSFYEFNMHASKKQNAPTIPHQINIDNIVTVLIEKKSEIKDIGIIGGKMGVILFFFLHGLYSKKTYHIKYAENLLKHLFIEIQNGCSADFTIKKGICGIGYGIEFLAQNKFISIDTNDLLSDLDEILQSINLINTSHEEFSSILYYVLSRMKNEKYNNCYSDFFILSLEKRSLYLINNSITDYIEILVEYVSYIRNRRACCPIGLDDIYNLFDFDYLISVSNQKEKKLPDFINLGLIYMLDYNI